MRSSGPHSSSRAAGRSVVDPDPVPGDAPADAPGDAAGEGLRDPPEAFGDGAGDEPFGPVPRASSVAAEPGVIVDSPMSKRSTAKRTGAAGSIGGRLAAGDSLAPDPLDPLDGPGVTAAGVPTGLADGDCPSDDDGLGGDDCRPSGVALYTPSDWVAVYVRLIAPAVPAARSRAVPSGRTTWSPVAPLGIPSWTGEPGARAPVGVVDPPSSSPTRFERRIGKPTWSGRSDRRGSKASTAVGRPARWPA